MANTLRQKLALWFGINEWAARWDPHFVHAVTAGNGVPWEYTVPTNERWHLTFARWRYQNSPSSPTVYLYLEAYRGNQLILQSPAKAGQAQGTSYYYNMGVNTMRFSVSAINNVITDPLGDWWYLLGDDRIRIYAANQTAIDSITDITLYFRRYLERSKPTPQQELPHV